MTILEIVATAQRTGTVTVAQEQAINDLMWSDQCAPLDRMMLELLVKGLENGRIQIQSERSGYAMAV